jgi:two-component system phosphate regulon response regulator PhoB
MPGRILRGESVLVVEDDASLREMYRAALRSAGFAVVAVNDGAAALRHVDEWRPSAVVLDLALPHVGGRDVHRELKTRAATRDIPVIVVSGTDMTDLKQDEFAALLPKPIDPDAIVRNVEFALKRARPAQT